MKGIHFTSPTGSLIFSAKNSWRGILIPKKTEVVWKERKAGGVGPMALFVKEVVAEVARENNLNAEGVAALMQAMKGKITANLTENTTRAQLKGIVQAALSDRRVSDAAAKSTGVSRQVKTQRAQNGMRLRAALQRA